MTRPDGAPLLLDRDGPAAVITISRPERLNAVTYAMFARLPALLAEAAELPGVRELTALLASRSAVTQRAVKQVIARILDGCPRLPGTPLPQVRLTEGPARPRGSMDHRPPKKGDDGPSTAFRAAVVEA
jgi:hypothetical protein